ncbi:MAG: hypothetical protein WCI74_20540, partial [Actinomycetes bacterium]
LRAGLEQLRDRADERELFIAADSVASRDLWSAKARTLGFTPWSAPSVDHDRTRASAGPDALLDWRLLSASLGLVYTRASSFGEEAAVASGHADACVPLSAPTSRQRIRAASALGRAAVTYPHRRGWLTRTEGTLPTEES